MHTGFVSAGGHGGKPTPPRSVSPVHNRCDLVLPPPASMDATVEFMTVLKSDDAMYVALKVVPEGTQMTVYTKARGRARTSVVAVLQKTVGNGFDDWEVVSRPKSADASLLPETWPSDDPPGISSRDLADTLQHNPDLWADIAD